MIVDLREFVLFPATTILEAKPGEIEPFTDEVAQVNWVQARLSIQNTELEYYCKGDARAEVVLICSRCAREFVTELDGEADFIIRSDAHHSADERVEKDDEEYVYYHGNDQRVDVTGQVLLALILAVDMKPLCQEDCRGLCPTCGINWNEATCTCSPVATDSRWDGLKKLLGNNN
jgi:uncharacterized protein